MNVTPDTNVLVRIILRDDLKQADAASAMLESADLIAITLPCFCELVWVLQRFYKLREEAIAMSIEAFLAVATVTTDRPAVVAGLAVLRAGGDFADGVIAYQGRWLGGETFASFDKRAVAILAAQGHQAKLLAV